MTKTSRQLFRLAPLTLAGAVVLGGGIAAASSVPTDTSPTDSAMTSEAPATSTPTETTGAATTEAPVSSDAPASTVEAVEAPTEQLVWIPAGAIVIPGTLSLPAGADATTPAVLMLHGYASQRDEVGNMYADEAAALAERGIASLRIDFPGSGASLQGTRDLTYDIIGEHAVVAYDWLASGGAGQEFSAVGALGFSMGGHALATLATERPELAAAASWNGLIEDRTGGEIPEAAIADGHVLEDLGFTWWDNSLAYYESRAESTALTDFSTYAGPVLIVRGELDDVVPADIADGIVDGLEAGGNTGVTRLDVPGADHIFAVFSGDLTPSLAAIDGTADWFAETL